MPREPTRRDRELLRYLLRRSGGLKTLVQWAARIAPDELVRPRGRPNLDMIDTALLLLADAIMRKGDDAGISDINMYALMKVRPLEESLFKALGYTVDTIFVGSDEETGEPIVAPFMKWLPEHVDLTANEALAGEAGRRHEKESTLSAIAFNS